MKRFWEFKLIAYCLLVLIILALVLYIIRAFSDREIDDVTPGIYCEAEYLQKSDKLWVVPLFENKPVSDDRDWCDRIKSLNKTIGMHGVEHTFNEFILPRNEEYVNRGIEVFEKCFGYKPEEFKAPQLALSRQNELLLEKAGFKIRSYFNQWVHKVYHCSDSDKFSNKFNDLF